MRLDQRELCKDINCEDCPFMQDTCKLLDAYAEPSGDLISREDVLALINKAMFSTDNREMQNYIFNGLRRDVHNLPSADRPKGEWIDREKGADGFYQYRWMCSVCGTSTTEKTNFCGNCGSDMRKDEDR